MEAKTTNVILNITLEEARKWYVSDNETLKELALRVFTEKDLIFNFKDIKSFQDACKALHYYVRNSTVESIASISRASAAMFKLNIVRKALNFGHDMYLVKAAKDSHIYYPYNPFIAKSSTYFENKIKLGIMDVIGKIKNDGIEYIVLNGIPSVRTYSGLAVYNGLTNVGSANIDSGLLGCASKEIAKHFGKYFGMLITEAKYADLPGFEITENKYGYK